MMLYSKGHRNSACPERQESLAFLCIFRATLDLVNIYVKKANQLENL